MTSLKEKTVWLTGASSGIGRALAVELARRGARLGLTSRSAETLDEVRSEVESAGGSAVVAPADVKDPEALKEAVSAVTEKFGALDMVIANAGTHIESWPEREFRAEEYLDLMEINYGGMLRTIEAALPAMREPGRVVGVASLAGYRGLPRAAAYGASKSAMIHFLESTRFHLERRNIAVTIVNPGFVKTPLTDKNDFHMPFLTDADVSARIICDGLERGKDKIAFPRPFNWFLESVRILPSFLYNPLVKFLDKRA